MLVKMFQKAQKACLKPLTPPHLLPQRQEISAAPRLTKYEHSNLRKCLHEALSIIRAPALPLHTFAL